MWYVRLTDGTNRELETGEMMRKGGKWGFTRLVEAGRGTRFRKETDAYWCGEAWHQQGPDREKENFWEMVPELPEDYFTDLIDDDLATSILGGFKIESNSNDPYPGEWDLDVSREDGNVALYTNGSQRMGRTPIGYVLFVRTE